VQYISQQHMSQSALAALHEDFLTQTEATMPGKAAAVLAKIVDGKVAKWCREVGQAGAKRILTCYVTCE